MSWTSSNSLRLLNLNERNQLKKQQANRMLPLDPISLVSVPNSDSENQTSFSRDSESAQRTPIILNTNDDGVTTSQEATPEQLSEIKMGAKRKKVSEKAKEVIKEIKNVFIPEE